MGNIAQTFRAEQGNPQKVYARRDLLRTFSGGIRHVGSTSTEYSLQDTGTAFETFIARQMDETHSIHFSYFPHAPRKRGIFLFFEKFKNPI